MREDKQAICNAMLEALKLTSAAGSPTNNPVVELRYLPEGNGRYTEAVRPVFADGNGENGWYDINVSCDSGIAVIMDIVNQFVKSVW